jgi:hypothetical protein
MRSDADGWIVLRRQFQTDGGVQTASNSVHE